MTHIFVKKLIFLALNLLKSSINYQHVKNKWVDVKSAIFSFGHPILISMINGDAKSSVEEGESGINSQSQKFHRVDPVLR